MRKLLENRIFGLKIQSNFTKGEYKTFLIGLVFKKILAMRNQRHDRRLLNRLIFIVLLTKAMKLKMVVKLICSIKTKFT